MTIRIALHHKTEYIYDRRVGLSPQVVRLKPAPHCRTPIVSYSLKIEPTEHFINWQQDPFGNFLARLVFPEKTTHFAVEVDLVADLSPVNPFDFFIETEAEQFPFTYDRQLARDLLPYLEIRERGPQLERWLAEVDRSEKHIVDFLVALNQHLQQEIGYVVRLEPGIQTCEETLTRGTGSCRDSAWLLTQIFRHLGLAARFVSGYLVQLAPDVKSLDGPSGPEQDFTDLHAWTEVYVPGAGWLGLDPTSALFAGEGHIPLACTPDPTSAAPVTGYSDPCETELRFENRVTRIAETPRVTRPYTDAQWEAIDTLGNHVDEELARADVRLTMGGEPTFVSIDNMDAAEWNTDALGDHKHRLAGELFDRLCAAFTRGGLPHHGQGKWYPGEPMPRWALTCYWRGDGEPLWRNTQCLGSDLDDTDYQVEHARRFSARLAANLGLNTERVMPAFEDRAYYLWIEGQVPANLESNEVQPEDPRERKRLAHLMERGLDQPAGFVLPLAWNDGWKTSAWPLRRERLYLTPGDSPIGYRLPLDSLPWVPAADQELQPTRDPFEPRGPLIVRQLPGDAEPERSVSGEHHTLLHTALCVEVRDGKLYVFLPPLTHLEYFVELIGAIEHTAANLGLRVLVEGYEPPKDHRLLNFRITPDPGVIEVNIHPAASWSELVDNTRLLYDETRLTRLGTEKFMVDGRHTGTGGGNHVTLGGPSPADSPLLRRPQLLRSLITYWQNHPALSYLLSGAFIGPTSQAPRVDEARDDNLYELDIAFRQLPEGDCDQPWMVDRVLRNLLVDVTGNTHRAEFCIDKLYSPDTPTGRLGLLELRAFEMPPHWQMSAVQMLLLRTLVARFWDTPYKARLVRWGTQLHDRFMLPHYIAEDLREVVENLREWGFPFDPGWFAPFIEFRFPMLGRIQEKDMELELRFALEPWHVLGEEVATQGTARFVDSSVERVQVKVQGFIGERYAVACNGRTVPLRATGREGEYVAGVRFKAWQPASGLHPTIGIHTPLVFDIVDTLNRRAITGCTYHVAHPAGRNYESRPVNALEADARRRARFWDSGHTPGPFDLAPEVPPGEHPCTLDLRRNP